MVRGGGGGGVGGEVAMSAMLAERETHAGVAESATLLGEEQENASLGEPLDALAARP